MNWHDVLKHRKNTISGTCLEILNTESSMAYNSKYSICTSCWAGKSDGQNPHFKWKHPKKRICILPLIMGL